MDKTDVRDQYKDVYPTGKRATAPCFVEVPGDLFVMVDGEGNPNTSDRFEQAVGALYAVSYTVKFASKAAGADFKVFPLEGLWWADDVAAFPLDRKDEWKWTLMIRQPGLVAREIIADSIRTVVEKGKLSAELADELRVERFDEGLCAQVLHIGPYEAEAPVIAGLHDFIESSGRKLRGEHHEVYLGDPRKAAPEKLKTLLRQPVE